MNRLANLQVLDSLKNNEKAGTAFDKWLDATYPNATDRGDYMRTHFIPNEESFAFEHFLDFIKDRESLLKKKIKEAFPSDFDAIVSTYALTDKLN